MAAAKTVPIYYTLTRRGHAWLEDEAPKPAKYDRVLAALGEMILDNDVPRTAEQVGFTAGIPAIQAKAGLDYLIGANYVQHGHPPKPSAVGEVPKIRIRPIEELVKAEAKAAEARKRYAQGKGKEAHARYEKSDKGRDKNVKYWKDPSKGRKVQKAYRLRRRQKELLAHLAAHPEDRKEVQPLLEDVARRLADMNGAEHAD